MKLIDLYNHKVKLYENDGIREKLDKLLSILLLNEIDLFEEQATEKEFYERYKDIINKKIRKIEEDFKLTKEEIIEQIERNGIVCNNYEFDKIWFLFNEGFSSVNWGLKNRKSNSIEEIYYEYFFDNELDDIDKNILNKKQLSLKKR